MTKKLQLKILHVVESFGGGSLSALTDYVRVTPELEHHLVCRPRPGEHVPDGEMALFATVQNLPDGTVPSLLELRRCIALVAPDVIHAHSSFAGAYVRVTTMNRARRRIVYTPHCFSFERMDISKTARAVYRVLEWTLMWNTSVVAGCSPREVALAKLGHPHARAIYVPNVAGPSQPSSKPGRSPAATPLIAGGGRLSRQKGVDFFLQVIDELRLRRLEIDAEWVGGGDPAVVTQLEEVGVHVTGWLSRSAARARMGASSAYVHTAAWEGFPLAILEARAFGVPVIARRIDALVGAPTLVLADSPAALATKIQDLFEDSSGTTLEAVNRAWDEYLKDNNSATQRKRLLECYCPSN